MSLLSKAMGSVLEKALMVPAMVAATTALGRFRLIELRGEGLKQSGWSPGDKLRVKLGDLDLRTYTPFSWDEKHGIARLVAWTPGRGPGSAWAESVRPGQEFHFKGPKQSLVLSDAKQGPVVFFGDESAFGAAAALRALRVGDRDVRFLFELDESEKPEDAEVVLIALGMFDAVRVGKSENGSHLETVRTQITEWAREFGQGSKDLTIFLVGNQGSLKTLKSSLQEALPEAKIKVKVYWREGKKGLD